MKITVEPGETEIPSDFDYEQATRAIMFEEAHGFKFKSSKIEKRGGVDANVVLFKVFRGGAYPKPCKLQAKADPAPSGMTQEATAKMKLKAGKVDVVLYRES